MDEKVNLAEKISLLEGVYQPGIVGHMNTGDAGGELTVAEREI